MPNIIRVGPADGGAERRLGTRIKLTEEKEAVIGQLHAEGKPASAIARIVGLTRRTVYKVIRGQVVASEEEATCQT